MKAFIGILIAALLLAACAQTTPQATPQAPSEPQPTPDYAAPEPVAPDEEELADQGLTVEDEACAEGWIAYQTQVGTKCIQQYDEKLIRSWPQCVRSTQCASTGRQCVFAARTPEGVAIKWSPTDPAETIVTAGFRCVPNEYVDMLIQDGMTSKDENGDQSTVIA